MVFIWCSGFYRFLWAYHFKDFYNLGGFYVFLWVYHFKDFYSLGGFYVFLWVYQFKDFYLFLSILYFWCYLSSGNWCLLEVMLHVSL